MLHHWSGEPERGRPSPATKRPENLMMIKKKSRSHARSGRTHPKCGVHVARVPSCVLNLWMATERRRIPVAHYHCPLQQSISTERAQQSVAPHPEKKKLCGGCSDASCSDATFRRVSLKPWGNRTPALAPTRAALKCCVEPSPRFELGTFALQVRCTATVL